MSGRQISRGWFRLACVSIDSFVALAGGARARPAATSRSAAVSLTAGTPQELEKQGDQMRSQKRYLDAIDSYTAAIDKQPTALLWNKKGIALLFIMRDKEAQKCFPAGPQAR